MGAMFTGRKNTSSAKETLTSPLCKDTPRHTAKGYLSIIIQGTELLEAESLRRN